MIKIKEIGTIVYYCSSDEWTQWLYVVIWQNRIRIIEMTPFALLILLLWMCPEGELQKEKYSMKAFLHVKNKTKTIQE